MPARDTTCTALRFKRRTLNHSDRTPAAKVCQRKHVYLLLLPRAGVPGRVEDQSERRHLLRWLLRRAVYAV